VCSSDHSEKITVCACRVELANKEATLSSEKRNKLMQRFIRVGCTMKVRNYLKVEVG